MNPEVRSSFQPQNSPPTAVNPSHHSHHQMSCHCFRGHQEPTLSVSLTCRLHAVSPPLLQAEASETPLGPDNPIPVHCTSWDHGPLAHQRLPGAVPPSALTCAETQGLPSLLRPPGPPSDTGSDSVQQLTRLGPNAQLGRSRTKWAEGR